MVNRTATKDGTISGDIDTSVAAEGSMSTWPSMGLAV
jgi:hypothetical protein